MWVQRQLLLSLAQLLYLGTMMSHMNVNWSLQPFYYDPIKDEKEQGLEKRERHLQVPPSMKKSKAAVDTNSKSLGTGLPTERVSGHP